MNVLLGLALFCFGFQALAEMKPSSPMCLLAETECVYALQHRGSHYSSDQKTEVLSDGEAVISVESDTYRVVRGRVLLISQKRAVWRSPYGQLHLEPGNYLLDQKEKSSTLVIFEGRATLKRHERDLLEISAGNELTLEPLSGHHIESPDAWPYDLKNQLALFKRLKPRVPSSVLNGWATLWGRAVIDSADRSRASAERRLASERQKEQQASALHRKREKERAQMRKLFYEKNFLEAPPHSIEP